MDWDVRGQPNPSPSNGDRCGNVKMAAAISSSPAGGLLRGDDLHPLAPKKGVSSAVGLLAFEASVLLAQMREPPCQTFQEPPRVVPSIYL